MFYAVIAAILAVSVAVIFSKLVRLLGKSRQQLRHKRKAERARSQRRAFLRKIFKRRK
jgi:hypothetical protein